MSGYNDIAKKFEEEGHSLQEIEEAEEEEEPKEPGPSPARKRKRIDFSAINFQKSVLVSE